MSVHTRRRSARGFTLIEVMVSLGIMMIGAMAVIALQTQTIRANSYARQVTIASQIAQTWIERLKEDAGKWTQVASLNGSPDATTVLINTQFLKSIVANAGNYVTPAAAEVPAAAPPVSAGFDYLGDDANAGPTDEPFYCAAYRLQWVYYGEAMRADVRVWWLRAGAGTGDELMGCGAGSDPHVLDPGGSAFNKYHVVYLSTVIRVTPLPR